MRRSRCTWPPHIPRRKGRCTLAPRRQECCRSVNSKANKGPFLRGKKLGDDQTTGTVYRRILRASLVLLNFLESLHRFLLSNININMTIPNKDWQWTSTAIKKMTTRSHYRLRCTKRDDAEEVISCGLQLYIYQSASSRQTVADLTKYSLLQISTGPLPLWRLF